MLVEDMKQAPEWNRATLLQSPLFAPLHPILACIDTTGFPTLQDCNALLTARPSPITTQSGMPLRFVVQQSGKLSLSLIHISEPTRLGMISYAVFCLKK